VSFRSGARNNDACVVKENDTINTIAKIGETIEVKKKKLKFSKENPAERPRVRNLLSSIRKSRNKGEIQLDVEVGAHCQE